MARNTWKLTPVLKFWPLNLAFLTNWSVFYENTPGGWGNRSTVWRGPTVLVLLWALSDTECSRNDLPYQEGTFLNITMNENLKKGYLDHGTSPCQVMWDLRLWYVTWINFREQRPQKNSHGLINSHGTTNKTFCRVDLFLHCWPNSFVFMQYCENWLSIKSSRNREIRSTRKFILVR